MRILIVDDESLIRMDLADILTSEGHEIVGEGTNGVEAITLCKDLQPDIVLMDVKMPKLDGIEAARQIGYHYLAPVVLLTSFSQQDLIEKARESGVYGYLIKPIREEQLVPTLEMALGRFRDDCERRRELEKLEATLEERKIIQKAVGILMETYNITENEGFQRIRSLAMKRRDTMGRIAQLIVEQSSKVNKNQISQKIKNNTCNY